MKYKWDKRYLHWGVTAFCVIACSILFYTIIANWSGAVGILHRINKILDPILIGIIIAYIFSPILNFFERSFLTDLGKVAYPNSERNARIFSRVIGIIIVLLILLALLTSVTIFLLPRLYYSLHRLVIRMQDYYNATAIWIAEVFNKNVRQENFYASTLLKAKDYFTNWVNDGILSKMQDIVVNVSTGVIGFLVSVFDFFVGIVISIYVMYRKEEFIGGVKKIVYSIFSEKATASLIRGAQHIHRTFGQFIVGKIIDSTMVGLACALFMTGFKMPYAALVSVIVGVTDMIPFFGPMMGAIPSIILIFLEDPFKCVVFTAFLLILHAFNGNIVEPRIIGESTGMSGFWILFSILFFGGIFGVLGMLIGVPIFAVIYTGVASWCRRRLEKKNLPLDTAAYEIRGPVEPPGQSEDDTGN